MSYAFSNICCSLVCVICFESDVIDLCTVDCAAVGLFTVKKLKPEISNLHLALLSRKAFIQNSWKYENAFFLLFTKQFECAISATDIQKAMESVVSEPICFEYSMLKSLSL